MKRKKKTHTHTLGTLSVPSIVPLLCNLTISHFLMLISRLHCSRVSSSPEEVHDRPTRSISKDGEDCQIDVLNGFNGPGIIRILAKRRELGFDH